jgi:hypothetical protein
MANANMYDTQALECSNPGKLAQVPEANYRQRSEWRVDARNRTE